MDDARAPPTAVPSSPSSASSLRKHIGIRYLDGDDPAPPQPVLTHWHLVRDAALVTPAVRAHRWPEGSGTSSDPFLVDFLPAASSSASSTASTNPDPRNPLNLPVRIRWLIAFLNAFGSLALSFASSAYTTSVRDLQDRLAVSQETAFLGTSLFVLGFALGPLVWAPLSEAFGRRPLFLWTYGLFVALNTLACLVDNIFVIVAARGFAGMFGASSLVSSSSGTADLFTLAERGKVSAWFGSAPFLGPILGPIVGGVLSQTAGWKGVGGIIAAMTGLTWIAYFFVVPETYAPVLLRLRAARLTKLSTTTNGNGNNDEKKVHYLSRLDKSPQGAAAAGPHTLAKLLRTSMIRPFRLLFGELIIIVASTYMAIIFGAMYLMFAAFPIVFQSAPPNGYGFSQAQGGLAFSGMGLGMVLALVYLLFENKRYTRIAAASPGGKASPETRLEPAKLGAVVLTVGLVLFAVTDAPDFHFLVPILGTVGFGFGMVAIFISSLTYLIDVYTVYGASAMAAATTVRSIFACVFPLFTQTMFTRLGVHWGAAVPAGLAALCMPFPFLFCKYGEKIRAKAKYATEARNIMAKLATANKPKAEEKGPDTTDQKKDGPSISIRALPGSEDGPSGEKNGRPLSELSDAHGPTADGEWQCYGRFCLGCSVDDDNFLVCRNVDLYDRKYWAMQ